MKPKQIAILAAGLLVMVGAVLITVPFLIPKDLYRSQIERAATEALQRQIALKGDVELRIFPTIAASIGGVSVANPEGFSTPYMVEAGELRSAVKLMPLFSGRVEISELTFVDAAVSLERLADGRTNWVFGTTDGPQTSTQGSRGQTKSQGFNGGVAQARLANASLTYRDAISGDFYELRDLDLTASMKQLDDPFRLRANGKFQEVPFDLSLDVTTFDSLLKQQEAGIAAFIETPLARLDLDVAMAPGLENSLTGKFSLAVPDIEAIAEFLSIEQPLDLAIFGGADVRGDISGPVLSPMIAFEKMSIRSEQIRADYEGNLQVGPEMSLDGRLSLSVSGAGELLTGIVGEMQALSVLERINLEMAIDGPLSGMRFSEIDLRHEGKLLNAGFQGAASLAGNGSVDGSLSLTTERLAELLEQAGTSTGAAAPPEAFALSGRLTGSFARADITDLSVRLDDVGAQGMAGIDLAGPRPKVRARLDMGRLDLSPFLAPASEPPPPAQEIPPWNREPIELSGLSALDAEVEITSDELIVGAVTLRDAALTALLEAGRLDADLQRFSAFGGQWAGTMSINAGKDVPEFSFSMEGRSVLISELLGTLAGFDRLTGTGTVRINAVSAGTSIAQIMEGLNGELSSGLSEGALKGLNVSQLVRSAQTLQQAVAAGKLTELDFSTVLSPEAETDFTSFATLLKVRNGVADIETLKLLNPVLGIDGSGQINLGGQSLDVRLVTALDKSAKGEGSTIQLNGIPVPVRLSGSWNKVSISPDLKGVQQALQAELGGRLQQELSGRAGPVAGALLGNILGSGAANGSQDASGRSTEKDLNEAAERAARDAIGNLFTRPDRKKSPPENEN